MGEKVKGELKSQEKALLIGNPNVGKSVIFSALTGQKVISSNFAGTTVDIMQGDFFIDKKCFTLIDLPGTYSLEATSIAEKFAVEMLVEQVVGIIFVLDATNLVRSIKLALEVKKLGIQTIYALNMLDVANKRGIEINLLELEKSLGGRVIPTIATKEIGISELRLQFSKAINNKLEFVNKDFSVNKLALSNLDEWEQAKHLVERVKTKKAQNFSFFDWLANLMTVPIFGIIISVLVVLVSFALVIGIGKFLQDYVLQRFVDFVLIPIFKTAIGLVLKEGILQNILIGDYGIFVIGFEWIIATILPYVFLFYLVFSFLEDSGLLPRIAIVFEGLMRKIGLQGGSVITLLMGYGCAVPAIIGSRTATTKKERLSIAFCICFAVPCISQSGALISLFASFSAFLLLGMFLLSFICFICVALFSKRFIKGNVQPMVLEIPNLLMPSFKPFFKKLKIRMKHFLLEAELPMLLSIIIAALLKESGILELIARLLEGVVSGWLGLPKEAVIALILGIIRREMAVTPLLNIEGLTSLQAFVGGTVALLYLPCLSVFGVLVKEFNLKTAVFISCSTTFTAIFIAGLINQVARLFL